MGLHICYDLHLPGDSTEADVRARVEQLHAAGQDRCIGSEMLYVGPRSRWTRLTLAHLPRCGPTFPQQYATSARLVAHVKPAPAVILRKR